MGKRPLRIAYVAVSDPSDKRAWSGTHYYMARALESSCGEVYFPGPPDTGLNTRLARLFSTLSFRLSGRKYDYNHSPGIARRNGRFFSGKLKEGDYDVVFAPAASAAIAYLETDLPVIYLSDATIALMIGYYPEYSLLSKASIRNGYEIERRAIEKARVLVYPSRWAAQSAQKDFGAPEEKAFVIPFGANLDDPPPREKVLTRSRGPVCRLVFLAKNLDRNWVRKGGDIALETLRSLRTMGIPTELVFLGSAPPVEVRDEGIRVVPYLDKNDPVQARSLAEVIMDADFLILPTRAECYGIVFCEAGAFGLPVAAADTGGVSAIIRDGENGFLLPLDARGDAYATRIAGIYGDERMYRGMVEKSRMLYEKTYNWDAWGRAMKEIINGLTGRAGDS